MGGGFSVWDSRVSGGVVWWRVCWRWLIGGGGDVGVCFVCCVWWGAVYVRGGTAWACVYMVGF